MTRRRTVLIDGWYGQLNTGDDAYCAVGAHWALREWGVVPRFVGRPTSLPLLPEEARGASPERPLFSGHTRVSHIIHAARARSVVQLGGSRFSRALRSHQDLDRLRRLRRLEMLASSISVGPFKSRSDARAVGDLLGRFRFISVRDSASLDRLVDVAPSAHAHLGFDAAVLLPDVLCVEMPLREVARRRPVLGVSVCPFESVGGGDRDLEREATRLRRVQELVARVVDATGCAVRMLVMCGHPKWGDEAASIKMADSLAARTNVTITRYSRVTADMLWAIAECDAVIGMRLHASILAYALGVPFAVASYTSKNDDFAAEVGADPNVCFSSDGPDPHQYDYVVRLLEGDLELTPSLPLHEAKMRARTGLDLLGFLES